MSSLPDMLEAGFRGVDPQELRTVMRQQASTVAVVTTGTLNERGDRVPVGCTATSVVSVSLEPPLVIFALLASSRTGRVWAGAENGVIHLLHYAQMGVAKQFASSHDQRFALGLEWQWNHQGSPVLDDALAWLEVTPQLRVPAGDHLLIVALVTSASHSRHQVPLLHHGGAYTTIADGRNHPSRKA